MKQEQRRFNILRDALGNYDDLRSHVFEIKMNEQGDLDSALKILLFDLEELRAQYGLEVFASDELWGEMRPFSYSSLRVADVIDENGDIAGPPYLYVHWDDSKENIAIFQEIAERT